MSALYFGLITNFEAIYADGVLELNFVLASASTEDYDDKEVGSECR